MAQSTDSAVQNTSEHGSINCSLYAFPSVDEFSRNYNLLHAPLSLAICICGFIANIVNVVVLSQLKMRSSTNLLLVALSVGEGMVMAIYTFYVIAFRILSRFESGMPESYAYALLGCLYAQNLFHTFSTWMIVFLAAFRLAFMQAGVCSANVCNFSRARYIILTDCILSALLTSPFLFAHTVKASGTNETISHLPKKIDSEAYEVDFVDNKILTALLFVTSGVFIKALPIVLMTAFSAGLIHTLRKSQKLRERLHTEMLNEVHEVDSRKGTTLLKPKQATMESSNRNTQQTTNILFALILLYIITYAPQSVMLIMHHAIGECFGSNVYEKLGDFMDLLTLLNNGGNFLLYCLMSSRFRETFLELLQSIYQSSKQIGHMDEINTVDSNGEN